MGGWGQGVLLILSLAHANTEALSHHVFFKLCVTVFRHVSGAAVWSMHVLAVLGKGGWVGGGLEVNLEGSKGLVLRRRGLKSLSRLHAVAFHKTEMAVR